jgi:hypothetical protein
MVQKSIEGKPPQSIPPAKKKPGLAAGAVLSSLIILILEIILPAVLSAGALWFLFKNFNLWHLNRTLALGMFAVALVAISFVLGILLDAISASMRKGYRKKGGNFGSGPRVRLVKFALSGVVLPLVLFIMGILVNLPGRGTAMNYFILTSQSLEQTTLAERIASLVIKTSNPSTKKIGIQALEGFHSAAGLGQLVRVLNEGSESLRDAGVFEALSKAIASYGVQAKAPLLDMFSKVNPSLRGRPGGVSDDLFGRYFAGSFDSLRNEVKGQNLDPAKQDAQIAQVDAAEAELKKSLADMRGQLSKTESGDPRLEFVLRTFLGMKLSQDADLLQFAKTVAADASYPAGLRGNALLLIGKLGGKDELAVLYTYLETENELMQERALGAIAELQARNLK